MKRPMMRRAAGAATVAAAAVLAALALAGTAPIRSAHAHSGPASDTAQLIAKSRLLSVAPPTTAPPPVNLAQYDKCTNPKTYGSLPRSPVSALAAGYADAGKLDGALRVGFPSLALVASGSGEGFVTKSPFVFRGHLLLCNNIIVQLDYHGQRQFPPFTATFLGFGFAPVTATAILFQPAGSPPLNTTVYQDQGTCISACNVIGDTNTPFTAVTVAQVAMRLTNVQVNGVPLNVGPSCRTQGNLFTPGNPEAPTDLVLTGGTNIGDPSPSFGDALAGGTVAGDVEIPPFTGCVTPSGENLDPLLTASVSGPGNYVRTTVGPLCPYNQPFDCSSQGVPLPQDAPVWIVTHGGPYSATAPLTFGEEETYISSPITITCSQSEISGVFPNEQTGPIRGGVATVQWTGITGCKGTDGSTWQVAQQGSGYFGTDNFGVFGPRDASGNIDDVTLTLTGTGPGTGAPPNGSCQVSVAGYQASDYNDTGSVLTLDGGTNLHIFSSTCKDALADSASNSGGDLSMSAVYPLKPGGTIVSKP
jgi:hypothetical protein